MIVRGYEESWLSYIWRIEDYDAEASLLRVYILDAQTGELLQKEESEFILYGY